MFGEFLNIVFKSIKLDRSLYKDNKNFGEAAIYFAGLIMILDGVAGAVAANTVVKTAIGVSGLTAIITWFVWAILIYVIGVKLFPDKDTKIPFKKVLTAVGFAHAPGLIRFFAVTPELMIPIIFLTQFWIFAGLIISTKQILNLKSNMIWPFFNVFSSKNNSGLLFVTLINFNKSLTNIDLVTISKLDEIILFLSNDTSETSDFIYSKDRGLFEKNIVAPTVLAFILKLNGSIVNLIFFKSNSKFLLVWIILFFIWLLNLSVSIPMVLK